MAELSEILSNLGITPDRAGMILQQRLASGWRNPGPRGVSRVPQVPQASAPISVASAPSPGSLQFGHLNFDDGVEFGKEDDGGGGFWNSAVGKTLGKAIDIVDTPRAAVIAAGEQLGDEAKKRIRGEGDGGSFDEFKADTWRNQGFQEILDDAGMAGGWQRSALGFVGDVAADPTTYIGVGAVSQGLKKGGMEAGEAALSQAVRSGGRETISKAMAERALQVGLSEDDAVRQLVAQSAKRGRGAITSQGLRRAGVSAETATQLGIPKLTKTIGGKRIVGTGAIQEMIENGKGALKSVLGESAAAQVYRNLRVTNAGGRKALLDIARTTGDADKGFKAVASLLASQKGKHEGYSWADLWSRKAKDLLGDDLRKLDGDAAARITHAVEDGVQDEVSNKIRQFFKEMRDDLAARGVEIGELENYVSHRVTQEARASANDEVRKFVRKLDDQSFFENKRTLKAGDTFLGQKLKTGTIKEVNAISESVLGYKMFKDDIRDIMSDYMGQGGQTVMRKNIEQTLEQYGVAVEQQGKKVLDDTQGKALKETEKAAKAARQAQEVELTNGVKIRMNDEAAVMRKALVRERRALKQRIDTLTKKIANTQRVRYEMEQRIAKLEAEIAPLEANIETFKKVAAKQRGEARAASLAKVRRLEKQLADKQTEKAKLQSQAQAFMQKHARGEGRATAGSIPALQAEIDAMQEKLAGVTADADALLQANKALGEGPMPTEIAIRAERETADWINKQVAKDQTAVTNLIWSSIDDQRQLDWLTTAKADMDKAYEKIRKVQGRMNKNWSDYKYVREYVDDVSKMMQDPNYSTMFGSEIDTVRNLEASAAAYDMQAWKNGTKASGFESAARAMRAPGFGNKIIYDLEQGMRKITSDGRLAVPGWVDDAMTAEAIIRDPKFFPQAADFLQKFENVWKGWAVGRPGFLIRNAYSSAFGVYLEAGPRAIESISQFKRFWKMYRSDPNGYMEKAVAKWGPDMAEKMNEAMKVVNATGGGLAPAEFHTGFLHKSSWKPWSSDFGYIKGVRSANEVVEGVIRGGHALDVMKRGGAVSNAIDTIEKYHFNYRDISRLDRGIKHAIPFWTFFANNVALQAHVWTHDLDKLNRTYFNAMRNMGYGDEPEQNQPDWMGRNMGLPWDVNPEGNSTYLNVGLPSIDFARDAANLVDRPESIIAQTAPWVQLPAEAIAGKNFYTGRPLEGYKDAGLYGMIPGMGVPTGSGGEAITPLQADILNGLLPGAANIGRLTDGGQGLDIQKLIGLMTGVSPQQLTPEMRQAQMYREMFEQRAAEDRRRELAGM